MLTAIKERNDKEECARLQEAFKSLRANFETTVGWLVCSCVCVFVLRCAASSSSSAFLCLSLFLSHAHKREIKTVLETSNGRCVRVAALPTCLISCCCCCCCFFLHAEPPNTNKTTAVQQ